MKKQTLRKDVAAAQKFLEGHHHRAIDGDPRGLLTFASKWILIAAAKGEFDLNALARIELANRGIGASGSAAPFQQAAQDWLCEAEETKAAGKGAP